MSYRALVMAFDEWETVRDRRFFYTSIVAIILVILGFAFKAQIPILRDFGIEVVAMMAAVFMMLLHAKDVEHAAVVAGDMNFPGVGWPGRDGRVGAA